MRIRAPLMKRFRNCDSGAAAIEFAIVATLLVVFVLGIIEFGRALDVRNQISRAADAGARTLLVPKSADLEGDATAAAKAVLTTADPNDLTVVLATEVSNGVTYRKLTLTYAFTPLVAGIISPLSMSVERIVCPVDECKTPS